MRRRASSKSSCKPSGSAELRQLFQDFFTGVPSGTQVTFALFFDNDLFKDSLNGLFAALGVLVVEHINDLLLCLK